MIDSLLLSTVRVTTYREMTSLTGASGFFFERDDRLYLVTSRHVMLDEQSGHDPTHLHIELHTDANNIAESMDYNIPLYTGNKRNWKQCADSGGSIDVAIIELFRSALPKKLHYTAFTPASLVRGMDSIEIGTPLVTVGFPLGFHDALHHLPVARHAMTASAYGLRFQGKGFFITDARMHRGSSGAPVVTQSKRNDGDMALPWILLGVHSSKFDIGSRELGMDESLEINCVWYADVLMTLTEK